MLPPFLNHEPCYISTKDTVAERLRRSTRNRLGLSRVGSSPTDVEFFLALYFVIEYRSRYQDTDFQIFFMILENITLQMLL